MLLCDAADQVNGKLYILGGGWSTIFAVGHPANVTLAVKLLIPWDQTNRPHAIAATLLDDDGEAVDLGMGPVRADGQIEVGRPPGLKQGTPIDVPLVFPFGGLLLEPGGYVFTLEVDTEPVARTPFRVVAPPPGMTVGGSP